MFELDAGMTKEINVSYYHIVNILLNSKENKSYWKIVKLYCEKCEKMKSGKIYMHIFICILFKQRKCDFFQYEGIVYAVDTKW